MKNLLLAASILLSTTAHSLAAEFVHLKSNVITISGEIEHGDDEQFRDLLEAHPNTKAVSLDSPGGYVEEGMDIAMLIHENKLTTYIVKDAQCVSICSILFFSGNRKFISADGRLGVHTAFDETTLMRDEEANAMIGHYLEYLGYDEGLLDLWVGAEPESMNTINDSINRELNLGIKIMN